MHNDKRNFRVILCYFDKVTRGSGANILSTDLFENSVRAIEV